VYVMTFLVAAQKKKKGDVKYPCVISVDIGDRLGRNKYNPGDYEGVKGHEVIVCG